MEKKPKKTRDLEKSRAEFLNAAFPLVYKHGFQGVSVDDIVNETSFTKGAFYHQFPTKLHLGYALVEDVIVPMIEERWIKPLEAYGNPLDGIVAQMQALIGGARAEALKYGCPLNNLVQEMAPLDKDFNKRLQAGLNLWIDKTDLHLQRAQAAGYLQSGVATRDVAHFIVMAHEGFFGLIKGLGHTDAFEPLMHSLQIFFRAVSAPAP